MSATAIWNLDQEGLMTANVNVTRTSTSSAFWNKSSAQSASVVLIESYQQTSLAGPPYAGNHLIGYYNGIIFTYGGFTSNNNVQHKIGGLWAYNTTASNIVINGFTFTSKLWVQPPNLSNPGNRAGAAGGVFGTKFFLFGGVDDSNVVYNDFWYYDLTNLTWTLFTTTNAPSARADMAYCISSNRLFVFAGNAGGTLKNDGYQFSLTQTLSGGSWTTLSPAFAFSARSNSCCASDGTTIILYGGNNSSNVGIQDGWSYDILSTSLSSITATPSARFWSQMVYANSLFWLSDGTNGINGPAIGDMWAYNKGNGTWTQKSITLPNPRISHRMVTNGNIAYVYGGYSKYGYNTPPNGDGTYNDLWTADLSLATPVFTQLQGGMIWVNSSSVTVSDYQFTTSVVSGKVNIKVVALTSVAKAGSINISNFRVLYG